ncbi:hypothetical protein TNCV_4057251 [Trichonephila clavipes]|nr:hypothetical protein TNCV_4057251 [Trichonephila clavipes]
MSPSQYGGYDPRLVTEWVRSVTENSTSYLRLPIPALDPFYTSTDRDRQSGGTRENVAGPEEKCGIYTHGQKKLAHQEGIVKMK